MNLSLYLGQFLLTVAALWLIGMETSGTLPRHLPWERGARAENASHNETYLAMILMTAAAGAILMVMGIMRW
jgi:hypothetical protein